MVSTTKMQPIDYKEAIDFLLTKHYSGRKPQVKYAFGLYQDLILKAVITYGIPASRSLCVGIAGEEYANKVIELNRLCRTDDYSGQLSEFVAYTLKQLKQYNLIVVSYSDLGMNHNGYIYQACNFMYTGTTQTRTDKYTPNNKHSRHYTNEFNHLRKVRTAKNRYVYFACNKPVKKEYAKAMKYEVIKEYPKGENKNYILGDFQKPLIFDRNKNEYYKEGCK